MAEVQMLDTVTWINEDGSQFKGTLDNKPFIAKHYPLPPEGCARIIPFTRLREMAVLVDDLTTETIASRVLEELKTLSHHTTDNNINATGGTLIFIGNTGTDVAQCSIQ